MAPFVDEVVAGDFLSIEVKFLLKLARLGHIPAHPIGVGSRRKWRFRLYELSTWMESQRAAHASFQPKEGPIRPIRVPLAAKSGSGSLSLAIPAFRKEEK